MKIHLYQERSTQDYQIHWTLGFSEAAETQYGRFQDVAYDQAEVFGLRLLNHNFDQYPNLWLEYRSGTQEQILAHAEKVAEIFSAELILE